MTFKAYLPCFLHTFLITVDLDTWQVGRDTLDVDGTRVPYSIYIMFPVAVGMVSLRGGQAGNRSITVHFA